MCWCERLMASVAILLATLTMSSSSTSGSAVQVCTIQEAFTSPNIGIFYEEDIAISGCQSSAATSKEVHVINLLSGPASVEPGHRVNVTLNVEQVRTVSQVRSTLIVFVLNAAMPVTWTLTMDRYRLPIFNYRIEFPQNTSVTYPDDLLVDLKPNSNLPHSNSDLLDWVTEHNRAITTFSAIHGANTVDVRIGEDYSVPNPSATCTISDNFESTAVEAHYIREKPISGCEIDQASRTSSVRQVHVIELLSASHQPIEARPPEVVVDLKPIARGKEHLYNVVLVLKSHVAVTWVVWSEKVTGMLEILSPDMVQTGEVRFHSIAPYQTEMPETGADLVAWVVNEYGAVASYSEAQLANHFVVTVKESTNTDGLPPGPKTIPHQQAIGGPILEKIATVECRQDSIRVTLPKNIIADIFNLDEENVMLTDSACRAESDDTDLVLETGLEECGTKRIALEDKIVYVNEVIFSDSDYPEDSEGSGSLVGDPTAVDNPPPNDNDNQLIEQFAIRCEYLPSGEPITHPPPIAQGENELDNDNSEVTLYMYLFRATGFLKRVDAFPVLAPYKDRLFFEVGLEGSDQLTIVPNHCWIAPGGSALPVIIHELIVNSCPVDDTLSFPNTDKYIKLEKKSVKQFSFQVPKLDSDMLDFYVHCELGVCSKDGSGADQGIPLCANVMRLTGDSGCNIDSSRLIQGPLERLNVGPFQTNRRELPEAEGPKANTDTGNRIIIQGLSAGPAAAVAFAAFAMGVVLTACLWYIHAHTGPRTEPPASPQTVSTPSSPSGNGHILNGHIGHMPNGFLMNGALGNGYVPNGGINPNRIPPHGMMHGDPNAEEMV